MTSGGSGAATCIFSWGRSGDEGVGGLAFRNRLGEIVGMDLPGLIFCIGLYEIRHRLCVTKSEESHFLREKKRRVRSS